MVNKKKTPIKRMWVIFGPLLLLSLTGCQSIGKHEAIDFTEAILTTEENNKIAIEAALLKVEEKIKKEALINNKIIIKAVKEAVKAQKAVQVTKVVKVEKVETVVGIDDKIIIGAVEEVELLNHKVSLNARIDTGATTTSINAQNIKKFERDGKKWVKFEVHNKKGKIVALEKPINRMAHIKRHEADNQKRYVVKLKLKLGKMKIVSKVTLADRSNFDYPLLIGRNVLTDMAIVDVSKEFTTR